MNDHDRKCDAALAELEATKMWPSNYAPPMFKAQRRMGWQVRPPHFAPFWQIVLSYAAFFGTVWGLIMWFLTWSSEGVPVAVALQSAAIAGVLFGLTMAVFYAYGRRKWKLSRWADL